MRSLLRSAILRTLTVLLSRLDALVLSPASDPAGLLFVPRTVRDLVPAALPVQQRFNFDIVRSAWFVRAALAATTAPEQPKQLPTFVQDALFPWCSKLDVLIARIMTPLVAEIKRVCAGTIARAKDSVPRTNSGSLIVTADKTPVAAVAAVGANGTSTTATGAQGPSYLRDLANQLDAVRKLFSEVLGCGTEADKWIVGVATHVTWKGMLAYAARPCPVSDSPPPTTVAMPPPIRKSTSSGLRPKPTLPLLRSSNGKRSPSPPNGASEAKSPEDASHIKLVNEVASFRAMIIAFAAGVLPSGDESSLSKLDKLRRAGNVQEMCDAFALLPELPPEEEFQDLTKEAMYEALLALGSFELVLRALKWPEEIKIAFLYDDEDSSSSDDDDDVPRLTPSAVFNLVGPSSPATRVAAQRAKAAKQPLKAALPPRLPCETLDRALDTLPPLISFHLLASRLPLARCHSFRLPHEAWNLQGGWAEYEVQLKGFASGEEFAEEVGWEMVSELNRLKTTDEGARIPEGAYEDLLRVAVQAEVGV